MKSKLRSERKKGISVRKKNRGKGEGETKTNDERDNWRAEIEKES